MKTELAVYLDSRIKGDRKETIEAMATAAGISVSTVNQILAGSIKKPPMVRLEAFADVLNCSINKLAKLAGHK